MRDIHTGPTIPEQPEFLIVLETPQLSVEPGKAVNTNIILVNHASPGNLFRISLEGLPGSWVSITPPLSQIPAGEQRQVSLSIRPTHAPQTRPGRYPFTIRVINQQDLSRVFETRGTLSVGAYTSFRTELAPTHLRPGDSASVTVYNQGNAPETYNIYYKDPEGALTFTPPQSQLRMGGGEAGVAEFRVDLRSPHWVGMERTLPFSAQVVGASGEHQSVSGEAFSIPIVPAWAVAVVGLFFICLISAVSLYFTRSTVQVNRQTATVIAQQTGTVQAYEATLIAGTATADFLANANQATLQSVTATVTWMQADDDGDTLLNSREVELGTNPGNPDTDQDGLNDGDEIVRGTDPLKPDTDEDTLRDGDEVARGSNPLSQDTDGDGIPDPLDAAPAQTSTPASDPAATAAAGTLQAALTQTAAANLGAAAGTATAQAIGTAAAATATAQSAAAAGTATAQAATATAIFAQTPTPMPSQRAAYIYIDNLAAATEYQHLMAENNYIVDLITLDTVASSNFSPYALILLGPDTGGEDTWGDAAGEQLNRINATGLPVIGLGEGGYAFFGRLGIPIGYPNGRTARSDNGLAVNAGDPLWTTPNPVSVPASGVVALYRRPSEFIAIHLESIPAETTPLVRSPEDANDYTVVRFQARFALWGYTREAGDLTDAGEDVFINLLDSLTP